MFVKCSEHLQFQIAANISSWMLETRILKEMVFLSRVSWHVQFIKQEYCWNCLFSGQPVLQHFKCNVISELKKQTKKPSTNKKLNKGQKNLHVWFAFSTNHGVKECLVLSVTDYMMYYCYSLLLLCESCFKCLLFGTVINIDPSIKGNL